MFLQSSLYVFAVLSVCQSAESPAYGFPVGRMPPKMHYAICSCRMPLHMWLMAVVKGNVVCLVDKYQMYNVRIRYINV